MRVKLEARQVWRLHAFNSCIERMLEVRTILQALFPDQTKKIEGYNYRSNSFPLFG